MPLQLTYEDWVLACSLRPRARLVDSALPCWVAFGPFPQPLGLGVGGPFLGGQVQLPSFLPAVAPVCRLSLAPRVLLVLFRQPFGLAGCPWQVRRSLLPLPLLLLFSIQVGSLAIQLGGS